MYVPIIGVEQIKDYGLYILSDNIYSSSTDLPSQVFVISVTNKQWFRSKCVWLNFYISTSDLIKR